MEQLNRIEIRGNVGNVSINTVGDTRVAHFSVATNYAYKTQNGEPVIDTTWHNVTAWEGNKGIQALDFISKGTPVYVCGRLRIQKYSAQDGSEKFSYDVLANKVVIEKEKAEIQFGS